MAKGRKAKSTTLEKMIRVLQTVNALAPANPLEAGEPIGMARFCELAGMSEQDAVRIIDKIDYGCGDALPAAWIEVDDGGHIVPQRLDFAFDGLMRLSRSEAFSLLVALRSSGMDNDGHLARLVAGALPHLKLDRFDTVAGQASVPNGALEVVADAVARRHVLAVDYRDAKGERSAREVEPLAVWYDTTVASWSFSAWCRTRQAVRTFRLDRLQATPVPTGETFAVREEDEDVQAGLDMSRAEWAVLAVHDHAAIDKGAWPGIEVRRFPSAEESAHISAAEQEAGAYVAQIPWVPGSAWLPQAVVASLGGVEVISPTDLRTQVGDLARALLEKLGC